MGKQASNTVLLIWHGSINKREKESLHSEYWVEYFTLVSSSQLLVVCGAFMLSYFTDSAYFFSYGA